MKCLIIGLDGATWDMIKPWAQQGILPTMNRFICHGVWGTLESVMPPTTGAAWSSFAAGKNPGKTGIYDFVTFEKGYTMRVITSNDVKSKLYYEYLDDYGYKSILVNLPVSYPPKKINGIIVTSLLTQDVGNMVYPCDMTSKYADLFKGYKIYTETSTDDPLPYLKEVSEIEKTRYNLAKQLAQTEKWDHFFLLFSGTDWVSHCALGYVDEPHNNIKDAFINQFQKIDTYIKWFLDNTDANIILMSDHGLTHRRRLFYINEWLYRTGYACIKTGVDENPFMQLLQDNLTTSTRKIAKAVLKMLHISRKGVHKVDKQHSKAFCPTHSTFGIYINDQRFEKGIVNKEKDEIKEDICAALKTLKDLTGEPLFECVWKKEEVYSGPYSDAAPDIVILPKDGTAFRTGVGVDSFIQKDSSKGGCHTLYGIFAAYGPDIKKGRIKRVKIYDIAPTVLHMYGVPVPADMDGKVLNIFKNGSELKRPVVYQGEKERIKTAVKRLDFDTKR